METSSVRIRTESHARVKALAEQVSSKIGAKPPLTEVMEAVINLGLAEYERRYLNEQAAR